MIKRLLFWRKKILSIGADASYSNFKLEQVQNANLAAIFASLYCLLATFLTSFFVPIPYVLPPLFVGFLFLIGLWFNHKKMHDYAGSSSWILSSLLFFWLANAYGKNSDAYFLIIISEILTIFSFQIINMKLFLLQLSLPILFALMSYYTHFSLFLIPDLNPEKIAYLSPVMYFTVIASCITAVWIYGKHIRRHFEELEMTKSSLQEKCIALEKTNLTLTKTNEELDEFVYKVSHDLRGPITSVMGLIDLCKIDKENTDSYLALQNKSMQKLDNFIEEIMYYSRNARLAITPVVLDIEKLILESFEKQTFAYSAEAITLKVEVKGNYLFYGDEFRLNIILNNLISNAIRYRNTEIVSPYLHFEVFIQQEGAKIRVSDNGIGISAQHLPHIFEMFYRANAKVSGSGLGLYIVKEAIHKMKGQIEVQSEERKGTTFMLDIPNIQNIFLHQSNDITYST